MSMLYTRTAHASVEDVGARVEAATASHGFGVIGVIDLQSKMREKGVEFDAPCRIYEVCQPLRAKEVLERDMNISTALPCRISVYEQDGAVTVATLLPTELLSLFGATGLDEVAAEVERVMKAIVDDAAESPGDAA